MIETRIEHYADIGYAVRVDWRGPDGDDEGGAYHVDFKAVAYYPNRDGPPQYQRADALCSPDLVESIDGAEVFAEGSVKWDGCADFTISEEGVCIHTCTRADMIAIGTLIARVHDVAAELMPMADWESPTTRAQREGADPLPALIALPGALPWCQSCQSYHASDFEARRRVKCFAESDARG